MIPGSNSRGRWTTRRGQNDGPFRPGKTADERKSGVTAQHRANRATKADENRNR